MKTKLLVAVLAVATCGAAAGPAGAGQIYIGLQDPLVNSGNITFIGSGSPAVLLSGVYGSFDYSITASNVTGNDLGSTLNASTISSASGGDALTVYITELGLTSVGLAAMFTSSLTENLLPSGFTMTELTGMDPHNSQFVTPDQLALATYSGDGTKVTSASEGVSGIYSVTEEYFFVAPGYRGNPALATIGVHRAKAVPETSTWAMLGIGFGGLALAGWAKRRRKDSRFAL
jgi:hypothetical protein